jgi:hypothetical protein
VKAYRAVAPYAVGLFGGLAGVAAVASRGRPAAEAVAELLGEEGVAVHVEGVRGSLARAAEEAARRLLERLGEEAQLRLIARLVGDDVLLPEAHVAAAAARAVAEMLGLEPDPFDVAEVLARATALAAGRPLAPVAAAAYTAHTVVASEQPPAYATVAAPPSRLYVIPPCRGLAEPPVAVEATRHLQLAQAAAVLAATAARSGWGPRRLWELLAQESPWDYAAPRELRDARSRAQREGAHAAGVEPYSLALVIAADEPGPAEAARARLEAAWACKPQLIELEPAKAPEDAEETG